ncbi:GCN5 family acetyltransferase [Candidatus Entotheonella serta]|nr:GCN5 family acetyltransferase [Candidatus Entotheonella serta]
MVGHYPALTKSGAGYVYDKVLEYRVWIDNGTDDRYEAFATYEEAKEYSQRTKNAEEPLVLVLQEEYINEPSSGVYEHKKEKRITEWQVGWLKGSLRSENPIPEYIEKLKAVK